MGKKIYVANLASSVSHDGPRYRPLPRLRLREAEVHKPIDGLNGRHMDGHTLRVNEARQGLV